MITWLWLRRHRRHRDEHGNPGPVLRRRCAPALDHQTGMATGPQLIVRWYRCTCGAVRTISREPVQRG